MWLTLTLAPTDTPFRAWRIPGVLQRFSITYFVVAITELFTSELYAKWKVRTLYMLMMYMYNWIIIIFHVTTFGLHLEPSSYLCSVGWI